MKNNYFLFVVLLLLSIGLQAQNFKKTTGIPKSGIENIQTIQNQKITKSLTDINDGFENYTDFGLAFAPWTTVDVDLSATYGIETYTFLNMYSPMAFMVFNPSATTPPITDPYIQPHSGAKFAGCFSSTTPPNNDWLISPSITLGTNSSVSFWVKSFTDTYGLERYKVGVSTTNTDPASFTIISGLNYLEAPAAVWQQKTFSLDAYNGQTVYIGIQCVSNDAFLFMVDDFIATTTISQTSSLSGMVTDAFTGLPLAGATVSIGSLTDITDAAGNYLIENVPSGSLNAGFSSNVTQGVAPLAVSFYDQSTEGTNVVSCSRTGYITYINNQVVIPPGETLNLNISLSPTLTDQDMRFVLNWGQLPSDLDSHLDTPSIDGNVYHVFYDAQGNATVAPYAALDHDVTSGFGPETMTIYDMYAGTYKYYIYDYSGSSTPITASQAVVQIYTQSGLLQTIQVPTSGTGRYWYVCDINGSNGQVTIRNTVQETSPGIGKSDSPAKKPFEHKSIISWLWNFGDGATSTLQNPSHIYSSGGNYTVSLTVNNGTASDTETKTAYISVSGGSGTGVLTGMVTDAVSGNPLEGALVSVAGLSDLTDVSGNYTINNIPAGLLTANFSVSQTNGVIPMEVSFFDQSTENTNIVSCSKTGYSSYTNNQVIIPQGGSLTLNISLSPALISGQMRIVLNWGATPDDLDSHLNTPSIDGTSYHIYYDDQGSANTAPYAVLDYDVMNGFGPETVTIYEQFNGMYQYYVHNYSESPEISSSQAVVQIYNQNGLLQTLQVPTSGTGLYWYVCDINGATGQITIRNVIQETAPGTFKYKNSIKKINSDRQTESITSWTWNFGDGSTSTQQYPVHTYTVAGLYTVSLTVSDGISNDSETKTDLIRAGVEGIGETGISQRIRIFPVPATTQLFIESELNMRSFEILDIAGRIVLQMPADGFEQTIDISTLSDGIYFLSITTSEGKAIKRFAIK